MTVTLVSLGAFIKQPLDVRFPSRVHILKLNTVPVESVNTSQYNLGFGEDFPENAAWADVQEGRWDGTQSRQTMGRVDQAGHGPGPGLTAGQGAWEIRLPNGREGR